MPTIVNPPKNEVASTPAQAKKSNRLIIPNELAKNSLLLTMLHGVRIVLEREMGMKHVSLVMDEQGKKEAALNNEERFPRAWMAPSDAQAIKDIASGTGVKRYGYGVGNQNATRNTSRIGHFFPIRLGFELKYSDSEPERLFRMLESFLIFSITNNLVFDVKFSNDFKLQTRIEVPDSLTIPIADTSDTTAPGAFELSVPLVIHTWCGFFRDVSSVYSQSPVIGYEIVDKGFEDLAIKNPNSENYDPVAAQLQTPP